MAKTEKIKQVMKALDNGKFIKIIGSHGFTGTLWEVTGRGGYKVIYWNHFGESANRRNLKNLAWIINTIFEKKGKDFEFRICNSYYED